MITYDHEDIATFFKGADDVYNPNSPSFLVARSSKYFFRGTIHLVDEENEKVTITINYGNPVLNILHIVFKCSRIEVIDDQLYFIWNEEVKCNLRRQNRGFF